MNNESFVQELSKIRPSSTFLTLHAYADEHGGLADYQIVFNMSYKNALQRSIDTLTALTLSTDLEKQARQELLDSFHTSLTKDETVQEEVDGTYCRFYDDDGKAIKGVRLHQATGNLHLYGLVVNKFVRMPGYYKKVNHKPLTVAKSKLRALTSVGKFRQFILNSSQVESVSVDKMSLLPPE